VADLPSVLGAVAKNKGVLHALYSDLAAPGVRQVGTALETVLKTGNILLLPLRMLNEYAANVERKNFKEIADRFCEIPVDDVIEIRPEIGTPILEKLSATEDPDLRRLFIELLASAADESKVALAHPSFVRVIESLSPDEAHILKAWKGQRFIPCLTVKKVAKDNSTVTLRDIVITPPTDVAVPSMISVYMANMAGLGLINHREDAWITEEGIYDSVIELSREDFSGIKEGSIILSLRSNDKIVEGDVIYVKGYIEILSYGQVFQSACMR